MHINQLKHKLLALMIIVSIAIFVIVLWAVANTSNRSNGENGSMSIEEIVRIQKKQGDILSKKGQNYLYAHFAIQEEYAKVRDIKATDGHMTKDLVQLEALFWYAKKNGIEPSDKDIERYMSKLLKDVKDSKEYDEFQKAAKKYGTTYEQILMNNIEAYRITQTIESVYEQFLTGHRDAGKLTEEERKKRDKMIKEEWDKYVKKIVAQYKLSDNYKSLRNTLPRIKEKYKKENE